MALPPFAAFPESKFRKDIVPEEWEACLDAWILLSEAHLTLENKKFALVSSRDSSLISFLISYFHEAVRAEGNDLNFLSDKGLRLRKHCFLLSHRLLSQSDNIPEDLLKWTFLADLSHVYWRSNTLRDLLQSLWKRKKTSLEPSLQILKTSLNKSLDSARLEDAEKQLAQLAPLIRASPETGTLFMTGSDFLDSLLSSYSKAGPTLKSKIAAVAFLGLDSLLQGEKLNLSLLSDQVYNLKSNADLLQKDNSGHVSLLSDVVTNTPLLDHIGAGVAGPDALRARKLIDSISGFSNANIKRATRWKADKVDKGKGKAKHEYGHDAFNGIHIHKMSLITQIQDLFPDLGSGFVLRLLDEYNDN
ncbi:MAG: hypothetical protein Q9157_003460, partial [Trypethelium eluteriae]